MKIFDKDGKYNFVDKNNVLVGYDSEQDCCEYADYLITKDKPKSTDEEDFETDLEPYVFSTTDHEKNLIKVSDAGGSATFKLMNGDEVLYLTIFNCHNGAYSHGFDISVDGKKIFDGCL